MAPARSAFCPAWLAADDNTTTMTTDETRFRFIHEVVEHQARRLPDAICLYPEGEGQDGAPITFERLWQTVEATARWLNRMGVAQGHRVMVVSENCPEMIALLFACSRLNAWPVCVNARLSSREIDAIASHCAPTLIFFTSRISMAAGSHAAKYGAVPCPLDALHNSNQFARCSPGLAPEDQHIAQAVATLVYTSGTTGSPKGVMVSHKGLLHFAGVSAASRRLCANDIAYAALPISHIFGLATILMASFHAGASLVLRARFDTRDVRQALVSPGLSILQGVPTMYVRMLSAWDDAPPVSAPALRYVYTGGAALDSALKMRVETLFGLPLHHGFGITEYAGSVCITDIDQPRQDCAAGYPVEGVEVDIRRDGIPVQQPGEQGDILLRGPGVMLGYYRNPTETQKALLPGGWLNTGDIGYLDASNALFITGRSKDMIIRSGFNVYPLEVEAVINAFPGIRLSAVVGRKQDDGNEEVIAFYEPEPGALIDETRLASHLAETLAPYKRPSRLINTEQIPTTLSGKIQKAPLRRTLETTG